MFTGTLKFKVYVNGVGELSPNITLLFTVAGDKGHCGDPVPPGATATLPEPVAVITTLLYTTEVPSCGNISTVEHTCETGVDVGVGVGVGVGSGGKESSQISINVPPILLRPLITWLKKQSETRE